MTWATPREKLGIVEQRQADRARYGKYTYRPPVYLGTAYSATPQPARVPLPVPKEPPQPPFPPILEAISIRLANPPGRPVFFRRKAGYPPNVILAAVCMAFGVTPVEFFGRNRSQRMALPRFAAAKLLRDKRHLSYPETGRVMRLDHSTIVHGYRRAGQLLDTNLLWTAAYRAAERALGQP